MPRSRIEIQKEVNSHRTSVEFDNLKLNEPSDDYNTYLTIKKRRDEAASELVELEKELAKAKARGEKGRSLKEIREELYEAESKLNDNRSMLYRATNPIQQIMIKSFIQLNQATANTLQQELNETIQEKADEDNAEIKKIKQLFEDRISSNPKDAEVYIERGVLFFTRGVSDGENEVFFKQANEDFTKAIKVDPNAKDAYLNRAELYTKTNDLDRAIADFNQVIRIDPENEEAYVFRGAAYHQNKDQNKAIADFDEAIRLNPKCKNAYMFRGLTYSEKGAYNKEKADYDKAAADIDKAIADIEAVLKIEPDDGAAADVLKNLKNEKGSVASLRRERQEQYERLVQEMDKAATEEDYQNLTRQLWAMNGYKNTTDLANKCDNKYQEIRKERELREAEAAARIDREKKELRVLLILSAVGFIVGIIIGANSGSVLLGMWLGIGIGGAVATFDLLPYTFKEVYREKGLGDAAKEFFRTLAVILIGFSLAGPIGLIVRVIRKLIKIKNNELPEVFNIIENPPWAFLSVRQKK